MLKNLEVEYNRIKIEIENMQPCHERVLRKILSMPSETTKPMFYFLTSSVPIKYLIQRRQSNYLHHILKKKYFFEQNLKQGNQKTRRAK